MDGVLELRNLHFWQLDFNQIAGTVDVRVRRDANEQMVLALVTEKLHPVVHILTVQVGLLSDPIEFFVDLFRFRS